MVSRRRARAVLDLLSGLLGMLAGVILVVGGTIGLPDIPGIAVRVTLMGLLGASFGAVGVGHISLDNHVHGAGEFAAGVGVILIGLSFGVSPSMPLFIFGVAGVAIGLVLLLADSFDIEIPDQA